MSTSNQFWPGARVTEKKKTIKRGEMPPSVLTSQLIIGLPTSQSNRKLRTSTKSNYLIMKFSLIFLAALVAAVAARDYPCDGTREVGVCCRNEDGLFEQCN
jgi:hypothetical protein